MVHKQLNSKHQKVINQHIKSAKKTFQYSLRLDDEHQKMLHQMAQGSTMANVIDNALETKWDYHQVAHDLMNHLSQFRNPNDVNKWVVKNCQNHPELLNQYAKVGAIINYTNELKLSRQMRQNYLNDLDTISYLLNKFGTNCNQLARRANAGGNVSAVELSNLKNQLMHLMQALELLRKRVA